MAANQSTLLDNSAGPLTFLGDPTTLAVLEAAAKTFVKANGQAVEIWAASRDWFLEEWGRDTFIALPGLLLTAGRYEEARLIFLRFAEREQHGLIPNVIHADQTLYNTVDASLWFIHALKAYVQMTQDWSFAIQLLPMLRHITSGYIGGTGYQRGGTWYVVGVDPEDGLVVSPPQATWMDADPSGNGSSIVTPRNGKCVEINALWYGALRFVSRVEKQAAGTSDSEPIEALADRVQRAFRKKFWNKSNACLYDVIEGDPHGSAIRPNQVIAISHGDDLIRPEEQRAILAVVERELLTPGGLRTLSPRDASYHGQYDTTAPMAVKDFAYHQGTVWPWLIGPYTDALQIVGRARDLSESTIHHEVGRVIAPLVRFCLRSEFKSLPEVFSGDPPYEPGGTTSQAWSIAEVLRVLHKIAPTFSRNETVKI
ncbi:MAG TPA: amylo-alpha-1,6-glucosidase [Verrucomicrobiae bacterium]|nr:amylo-alpha-1,6-glucosidase [Verrucomicrobiae bacterium]